MANTSGVDWNLFPEDMWLRSTLLLSRLQWHTKRDRMFPWHSSLKLGWCSQQLINALLTFSAMRNKLGPKQYGNLCYKSILSPPHKSWHLRKERPLAHQSSFTLDDRQEYNPMMLIQVCKYSFDKATPAALLFHSSPSLPLFLLFLPALWEITLSTCSSH